MKLLIVDEQYECSFEEFVAANVIGEDEINRIKSLQIGESCMLSVHFGWAEIKRIA